MRTRADVITEIPLNSGIVTVDEAGYLTDPDAWTRDFALYRAEIEGIELGDFHWDVLREIRDFYAEHCVAMDQRFILKYLAVKFDTNKAGAKQHLFDHFPYGYIKQALKIAGMRQPRGWSTG